MNFCGIGRFLFGLGLAASTVFAGNVEDFDKATAALLATDDGITEKKLTVDWDLPKSILEHAGKSFADAKYDITIDTSCSKFAEDLLGNPKSKFKARLEAQVKEAVKFLKDAHARLLGVRKVPFVLRELALCTDPIGYTAPSMDFERFRGRLRWFVGPRLHSADLVPALRDNLRLVTAEAGRKGWLAGDHWTDSDWMIVDAFAKRKNPLRKYWKFVDPYGELRVALREVIRREGLEAVAKLGDEGSEDWHKAAKKALAEKDKELFDEAAQQLGDENAHRAWNDIVADWRTRLASPASAEALALAALGAVGEMAKGAREDDIERWQVGLVNVENFHAIDVTLYGAETRTYLPYVEVPDKLKIRVRQFGLVNVSTADRVNVQLTVGSLLREGLFRTAALGRSVRETLE